MGKWASSAKGDFRKSAKMLCKESLEGLKNKVFAGNFVKPNKRKRGLRQWKMLKQKQRRTRGTSACSCPFLYR
ncbi:MAG: hypothetical protein A2X49_07255 [Lentisphaerae bacterium GWF2_52_8]|nr:MAG: hypothetical protein A2X49_07255 [Lentisphaerae bacterium GWF2_52_8]